ncbi:MAG: nickel pincer cofactor biosynthesis protein LarC [Planctomycetes bacterium]|nr:nickel pincer cofactor biosynthesis protein LarC [Planctomycetota bacterium]
MRVAHFDCFSGISGDMTLGALFDAGVPTQPVLDGIASLGLPIKVTVEKVCKGGFAATQVIVEAPEESTHRFLPDVEEILSRGKLLMKQRNLALSIFRKLAQAESTVHGMPIEKVHFHEVGALDSLADIVGVAVGLDLLGVERFTSSSVATGTGMVKCAHGMMPIPAPGTAELLKGAPLRPCNIQGELTTPTGAAILATVVRRWTDAPEMIVDQIGHGAGQRDLLEQPNVLRLFLGDDTIPTADRDTVWMMETNLDDVPGEVIGYCTEQLFAAGALDVFTVPIAMKKNRPGVMLSVLTPHVNLEAIEAIIFNETQTFGIRRYLVTRSKLYRQHVSVDTPWGQVQGKLGWLKGKPPIFTPEYDDCARIAREHKVPLREVMDAARRSNSLGGTP